MRGAVRGAFLLGAMALGLAAGVRLHATRPVPWSESGPWRSGDVRHVVIPAGRTVILDVDPAPMATLEIDGTLRIPDRPARLRAGTIIVRGALLGGTPSAPLRHRIDIALDTTHGDGLLAVQSGGRVALFGEDRATHTVLSRNAAPGASFIETVDPVLRAGDRVAIATTSFAPDETEERVVAAASGTTVRLDRPLAYRHWGTVTDGVDERAEIALLSHDVRVSGDPQPATAGIGGQVMVMSGGVLELTGVELERMGRLGALGAYPVHFHLTGDGSRSEVVASSIHTTFNRCIAVHGTSGVRLERNVGYDAIGHCFFLEDGVEQHNTLTGNIALRIRAAAPGHAILESDLEPAGFWFANPTNTIVANIAAGIAGTGFWYDLPPSPTGPSKGSPIRPRAAPLGVFDGNVAHSNDANGLFVDIVRNPPGVVDAPNYAPSALADFRNFRAYKNRRRGVWLRGTNLRLSDPALADNAIGVTFAGADATLRAGRIVGESENRTGPPKPADPAFPIRGFEFYDGRVGVEETHFAHFERRLDREASALSAQRFSPFFTDPGNYARGLAFEDAEPVYFEHRSEGRDPLGADGYRTSVFRDVDGSVTGVAGASVVLDTPLLRSSGCTPRSHWNAVVCPRPYGSLFIVDVGARGTRRGPVEIASAGSRLRLFGNPQPGADGIFQMNVPAGNRYTVRFSGGFPTHLRLGAHHFSAGDHVQLILPQAPPGARTSAPSRRLPDGSLVIDLVTVPEHREAGVVVDID